MWTWRCSAGNSSPAQRPRWKATAARSRKSPMPATTRTRTAKTATTQRSQPSAKARQKPGPKPKLEHSEQLLEQIRALGRIQATVAESASVLRCSERTLQNFFAEHADAKEAHEGGRMEG